MAKSLPEGRANFKTMDWTYVWSSSKGCFHQVIFHETYKKKWENNKKLFIIDW